MKLSAITATSAQVKAVAPGKSLDRRHCWIDMAAAVRPPEVVGQRVVVVAVRRALIELAVQAP